MAPPTSTAILTPAAFTEQWSAASSPRFQDAASFAVPAVPAKAPSSSPARSGDDRRERPRRGDRRSVLAVSRTQAVVAPVGVLGSWQSYAQQWLRPEVEMWFEDLRWGTPVARKLALITAVTCFLAFCVFVVMATFTGPAVL